MNMSDIISFANSYFYMCTFKYFCLLDCNIYIFLNITSICYNDDFYLCVDEEHVGEDALIMLVFLELMYITIYSLPSTNVYPREWIKVNIYRGVNN